MSPSPPAPSLSIFVPDISAPSVVQHVCVYARGCVCVFEVGTGRRGVGGNGRLTVTQPETNRVSTRD